MRKEIILYVDTGEQNEEVSIVSVAKNRGLLLLSTPSGQKFTVNKEQLLEAINVITEFDKGNNVSKEVVSKEPEINTMEVEYGEN